MYELQHTLIPNTTIQFNSDTGNPGDGVFSPISHKSRMQTPIDAQVMQTGEISDRGPPQETPCVSAPQRTGVFQRRSRIYQYPAAYALCTYIREQTCRLVPTAFVRLTMGESGGLHSLWESYVTRDQPCWPFLVLSPPVGVRVLQQGPPRPDR